MCDEPPAKRLKTDVLECTVSNEIWAIVLSFLDASTLVNVSCVCTTWAGLAGECQLILLPELPISHHIVLHIRHHT